MGKFNLSEAAKAVLLGEGSKETFDANITAKRGQSHHTSGHAPHGEVGADKLGTNIVPGTHEAGDIGTKVVKTSDNGPDAHKGAPTATPPGATPPVGNEPEKHLDAKFNQQAHGRKDLENDEEKAEVDPTSYENIRDRVKAKLAKQTFHPNPGAHFQAYGEDMDAYLTRFDKVAKFFHWKDDDLAFHLWSLLKVKALKEYVILPSDIADNCLNLHF